MMSSHPRTRCSVEEYLAIERQAKTKSEFYKGEVFALAGGSRWHNLIVANLIRELSLQLKTRPCVTYASDMRIKVVSTGLYAYPDVTVVCDPQEFEDEQEDTLLNPTVIAEVLSKSTESYDRIERSAHYRKLPSLKEYLLIAHNKVHVERYARQSDDQWLLSESENIAAAVEIRSVGCSLVLTEIYAKVELPAE